MHSQEELQSAILEAIADKKGRSTVILDLAKIESASAPEFIITQGQSTSQVSAIADNIVEEVNKRLDVKPYHSDGFRNATWIILDYGSIMVHVFHPEAREFYNLEELWSDGQRTDLPDE